jgi:hypothetical protein
MSEAAVTKLSKKKKNVNNRSVTTTGLLDILSPTVINFQNKTVINGEMYQRSIVIVDYPDRVMAGWLSKIVTMPGVVASIHATPTDPDKLIEQIKISMGELEAKLIAGGNPVAMDRVRKQYMGAKHLINKIDNEAQQIFLMTVILLVTAEDEDVLQYRCKRLMSSLSATGMRGRTPMFRQEEAFKTAGPYRILMPEIADLGNRNMPVETIAAMYPFVYSGINDGTGVLLGSDKDGGILLVDFWVRTGGRTNSNVTILGKPGVGKSTAIKKILMNEFARGTKIIIIDPESEYKDLCKNLGGDWIDCGGGKKGIINPLQVRAVPLDDEDEEDPLYKQDERGALGLHFQTLRTFFKLNLKEMTKIQQVLLEIGLEEVYKAKNIVWETDTTIIKNEEWPTIVDLYHYCTSQSEKESRDQYDWRILSLLLRGSAIGADKALWAGHTTIDAQSDFIVLDINQLLEADKDIRDAQFFNVLTWAWNKVAEDRMEKVIIIVDETYLLVDPEAPQPLQFLRNTSKRIRKYEGALMVITHNMNDFMDPAVRRYGQSLLDNPAYKIIMGQGENDIQSLTSLMHLSEKEIETLQTGNRGEALFIAGNRRVHAKFEISNEEEEMFGKGGGR